MYLEGDTTVSGSTFVGNHADYWGGAVYGYDDYITFRNSTFTGNHAENAGGIYTEASGTLITGSTFTHNIASDSYAGGAYFDTQATVRDTKFTDNHSDEYGGGVYVNDNVTLAGEQAPGPRFKEGITKAVIFYQQAVAAVEKIKI